MKKRSKHYDNKRDLIRAMKETQIHAKNSTQIAFSSQTLLSLYVLHNKFGFGQERCERFIQAVAETDATMNLDDIRNYLLEKIGFAVELPHEHITACDEFEEERIEF